MLSPRRARRRALFVAASLACIALSVPGFASAAALDSSILDKTVDQTVDSVLEAGESAGKAAGEAIAPVTDAVPDPVRDAVKPVTETVDRATKPVTDTVQPVRDAVDQTIDRVRDEAGSFLPPDSGTKAPEPTGTATTGTRSSGGRDDRVRERTAVNARNEARNSGGRSRGTAARRTPERQPVAAKADRSVELIPAAARNATAAAPDTIAEAIVDASRAFRFPLLVAAAVALFLALQSRMDGRDPKLSSTRADQELTFA